MRPDIATLANSLVSLSGKMEKDWTCIRLSKRRGIWTIEVLPGANGLFRIPNKGLNLGRAMALAEELVAYHA